MNTKPTNTTAPIFTEEERTALKAYCLERVLTMDDTQLEKLLTRINAPAPVTEYDIARATLFARSLLHVLTDKENAMQTA